MDLYGQIQVVDSIIQQKQLPVIDTSFTLIKTGIPKLPQKIKPKDTGNKAVEFHGTILIEGQYATRAYNHQQIPQNYLRTTITPQLSLWGIPFSSRINLSTEQFKVNYNLNRLNFSLDVNKLSNILLQRLKQKAKDTLNYDKLNKQLWEDSLQKLGNVDETLATAQKIAENKKKELETIEKQLPEITDSLKATDIRYRLAYKDYYAKQKEYEENLTNLDSLQELKKEYERLKKQYEKLKNTGAFEPDKIATYSSLPEKYKTHPLYTKTEKILLSIRSFSMGTLNPPSPQPYLQGTAINGISIENGFGKIYTSLQAGLVQQNLTFGELKQQNPKKYLYAAKAGWGMPENAHIHIGYTQSGTLGKNDAANASETTTPTPDGISITSVDGKLPVNQNFSVFGNLAIAGVKGFGIEPVAQGESQQLHSRPNDINSLLLLPSSYYSAGINGDFKQTKTKIVAQTTRVGSSFYSPLNPYLRNDQLKSEVKLTQKLYKEYFIGSLNYSASQDNLLHHKKSTTHIAHYRGSLSIRLKKLPSFTASYAIINQGIRNSEVPSFNYLNKTEVITITSVYSRRIKANILIGSLTYTRQNITNKSIPGLNRYYNNLAGNISVSDAKGNTITYTSNFTLLNDGPYANYMFNNQAEATYIYPKNTSYISTAGVYYTIDNLLGDNGGVFIRQNVSFWKKTTIALMLRQNFYKGHYHNNNTQYQTIVNIQLVQQW